MRKRSKIGLGFEEQRSNSSVGHLESYYIVTCICVPKPTYIFLGNTLDLIVAIMRIKAKKTEGSKRRWSFNSRKKEDLGSISDGNQSSNSADFSTIPHFSSMSDMSILHNAIVTQPLNADSRNQRHSTSRNAISRTKNVLRYGFQSRSYVDKWETLCDDPTVEESIECVFDHQLQEGIEMNVEDDDTALDKSYNEDEVQYYNSGKLVLVGSYSPFTKATKSADNELNKIDTKSNNDGVTSSSDFSSCLLCQSQDSDHYITRFPKEHWPQKHLLLSPTPNSGVRIIGVRYANENDYLKNWWNQTSSLDHVFCGKCCLPINDGNEVAGQTLVTDFESNLFEGTIQLRIRNAKIGQGELRTEELESGYFHGLNRHYQCIIQGRFKRQGIPMIHTFSGQTFTRRLKLPAPLIVQGGVKIMSFFAPMIHANLGSKMPSILTPLGSTPQTIHVEPLELSNKETYRSDSSISEPIQEPHENSKKLVALKSNYYDEESSSNWHTKSRKKTFDKLCARNDTSLTFQTDKVYTFEFLQHLLDFKTFEINLGNLLGSHKLGKVLNGQPMQIMSAYQYVDDSTGEIKREHLWSFDLWHESILP